MREKEGPGRGVLSFPRTHFVRALSQSPLARPRKLLRLCRLAHGARKVWTYQCSLIRMLPGVLFCFWGRRHAATFSSRPSNTFML